MPERILPASTKKTKLRCPTCKKEVDGTEATFPFCSKRCQTIDLGKWADESYMISRPIEQSDLDEE